MYCPQCGASAPDNTKFCRSCGLPLATIANFVASGGAELPPSTPSSHPLGSTLEGLLSGMTAKQRLVLTILFFVFAPTILGVIIERIGLKQLAGIPSVLIPIGIVWAVFHYKNQMRQLQQAPPPPFTTAPPNLPGQAYQPPLPPVQTNPLAAAPPRRGSVVEEETQHLPNQRS
jgi:hypothetical protein